MNTKGKIDFTKTDNIQFIEEVASDTSMILYSTDQKLDLSKVA